MTAKKNGGHPMRTYSPTKGIPAPRPHNYLLMNLATDCRIQTSDRLMTAAQASAANDELRKQGTMDRWVPEDVAHA